MTKPIPWTKIWSDSPKNERNETIRCYLSPDGVIEIQGEEDGIHKHPEFGWQAWIVKVDKDLIIRGNKHHKQGVTKVIFKHHGKIYPMEKHPVFDIMRDVELSEDVYDLTILEFLKNEIGN